MAGCSRRGNPWGCEVWGSGAAEGGARARCPKAGCGYISGVIVGRDLELQGIRDLLADARDGRGGALVIAGEAGVGKSTLLDAALADAPHALTVRGVEAERGMPYAALHLLCTPFRDRFGVLAHAHRDALEIALGLRDGDPPGRLILGLGLLGLLADAAKQEALVVAVDDLQWVDQPTQDVLLVAARRLFAESVAMMLALRTEVGQPADFGGLTSMQLTGLPIDDAAALLRDAHPSVVARLTALTAGNPLALVEAAQSLTELELSGARPMSGLPATRPEQIFTRRFDTLVEPARRAVRLLAVAGEAPREVLMTALDIGGLRISDLAPSEEMGLVRMERTASWRHPLARASAARGSAAELVDTHRALAAAWAQVAPDNPARAWHLADSAFGTDPDACAALVAVGELAVGRDASADAADAFERAACLCPDSQQRVSLLERAGASATRAGLSARACGLLDAALSSRSPGEPQARLLLARGRLEYLVGSPASAFNLLAHAIEVSHDPSLRVWAATEAHLAAFFMVNPDATQRAADLAVEHHDPSDPVQSYLAMWAIAGAAAARDDYKASAVGIDRAWQLMLRERLLEREPSLVFHAVFGEMVSGRLRPLRLEERAAMDRLRRSGDLTWLPRTAIFAAEREQGAGRLRGVYEAYEESELLSRLSGQAANLVDSLLGLAQWDAYRADVGRCLARCREAQALIERHGLLRFAGWPAATEALLHLSVRQPDRAVPILREQANAQSWIAVDLAYALHQCGRPVVEEEIFTAAGEVPDWAREYICALADVDDRRAAERLLSAEVWDHPLDRARYRLVAGQRLRRAGERRAARQALHEALDFFTAAQASPWVDRTQEELEATGTHPQPRGRTVALTPSESRVAELVALGKTNKDVAALLFVSMKTVEFHLSAIYRKLGVTNRTALARRLTEQGQHMAVRDQ